MKPSLVWHSLDHLKTVLASVRRHRTVQLYGTSSPPTEESSSGRESLYRVRGRIAIMNIVSWAYLLQG